MRGENLYQQAIKAHAKRACRKGRLANPDASATVDNPLCGDRVTIDVRLEDGRLAAVGHDVRGCLLCEAAASVIGCNAVGETPAALQDARAAVHALLRGNAEASERQDASWPAITDFTPVRNFKSRHECVLLPFEALGKALEQAAGNTDR